MSRCLEIGGKPRAEPAVSYEGTILILPKVLRMPANGLSAQLEMLCVDELGFLPQ